MLYVTTRSKHDVYTAPVTLRQDRASDGGAFVPFRMPYFEKAQIMEFAQRSFGQNVADILNLFFSTKLSGWDVEMVIGRHPVRFKPVNYRVQVVEQWRDTNMELSGSIRALSEKLHPDADIIGEHTDWSEMAIRIALLFGIFSEAIREGVVSFERPCNVAVPSGSFAAPMAAWYARQMGLPIDMIICGCNENGSVWELLHRGQMDTGVLAVKTSTPEGDHAVPPSLERLICGACGPEEALRFCWSCAEGRSYVPDEEAYGSIRNGIFAAVVSQARLDTIIPGVYRTNRYVLDLYSALAFGALSDYRSRTGKSTMTLLMSDRSPLHQPQAVADTMRISVAELKRRVSEG